MRPAILFPRLRERCRLTISDTGRPKRPVGDLLPRVGDLGIEALRIADGELHPGALGERNELIGLEQLHRDRLFQQHVLAGAQAVPGYREMGVLRRGADVDDADALVRDDVAVVERRGRRIGERLDLGEPIGADFADVQLLAQRRARQRFGADAAAPAGPDHCRFEEFHQGLSFSTIPTPRRRPGTRVFARTRNPGLWK